MNELEQTKSALAEALDLLRAVGAAACRKSVGVHLQSSSEIVFKTTKILFYRYRPYRR